MMRLISKKKTNRKKYKGNIEDLSLNPLNNTKIKAMLDLIQYPQKTFLFE